MAKPVSQSRTEWVKKGTIVGGKKVKKGYVAQKGKPEKRVTAKVRLETATRRGKAGDVAEYKKGRYKTTVGKGRVDRNKTTAGGGVTKAQAPARRRDLGVTATPPPGTSKTRPALSIRERKALQADRAPWKSGARRIVGSGSDGVNAASSSGSARTETSRDSFIPDQGARGRLPFGRGRQRATVNRPTTGQRSRLQKDKSGQLRWVKVN